MREVIVSAAGNEMLPVLNAPVPTVLQVIRRCQFFERQLVQSGS